MQCLNNKLHDNYNSNTDDVKKTCCIIDSAPLARIPEIKLFLYNEMQVLISEGYSNYITYFRPAINHCIIEILDELRSLVESELYIEAVWTSIAYFYSDTKREQKEFNRLASLCNRVGYIDERQTPQTMPAFCDYLASRCDLLYSAGDEFNCIFGSKNKRIAQAFQSYGRRIKIVKTRDLYNKSF